MTLPEFRIGMHEGIDFASYLSIVAVSQSALKQMGRSPLHCQHYERQPGESSAAQALGTATHCAVFEPERFARDYYAMPKVDRRTKAGKAAYRERLEANADSIGLDPEDYASCTAMANALRSSPRIGSWLSGSGVAEVTLLWKDVSRSLRCKARLDYLGSEDDSPFVLDVKTTADASPEGFLRDVFRWGYHYQAAWYLHGLDQLFGFAPSGRRFYFAAVEKARPYAVGIYQLDFALLAEARRTVFGWLDRYASCQSSGVWPGYDSEPVTLVPPRWAQE